MQRIGGIGGLAELEIDVRAICGAGPIDRPHLCDLLELIAADGVADSRHGVRQVHFPMDVASANSDYGETTCSRRNDVVVEGELTIGPASGEYRIKGNLRLVLEAGACAAFAIANPEPSHFVTTDSQGLLNSSQKLTGKIYNWLDENYPDGSNKIKAMKVLINASTAHANLVFTGSNFRENEGARERGLDCLEGGGGDGDADHYGLE
jgi:hypothetical protein